MAENTRVIEGFERYTISKNGEVWDTVNNVYVSSFLHGGYLKVNMYNREGKQRNRFLHRLLALAFIENTDPDKYYLVNHIDRIKTNNNLNNLEWCDDSINSKNRSLNKNSTTGYYGVCFHKQHQRFNAKIGFNNKRIHLGYFDTAAEAAKAYDKKAKELGFKHYNFEYLQPTQS